MELLFWLLKFPYKLFVKILISCRFILGKIFIYPVLKQSHQSYLDSVAWGNRWVELISGINYKIHNSTFWNKDYQSKSIIYIYIYSQYEHISN